MEAVTEQPRNNSNVRTPPISTINLDREWGLHNITHRGIESLTGLEDINIQQMIELNEMLSEVKSENRYKIFVPHNGNTIFYASELSTRQERMCCGRNRSFVMTLYDQSQREALLLKRTLSMGCCSIWCKMNYMEIWLPNGELVGFITQKQLLGSANFEIYNHSGNMIYALIGPSYDSEKNISFGIYAADGITRLGNIFHRWDQLQNEYNISVKFASSRDPPSAKILQVAGAFLLEYVYFLQMKSSKSRIFC